MCLVAVIVAKFDLAFPDPESEVNRTRGILWRVEGELPLLTKVTLAA